MKRHIIFAALSAFLLMAMPTQQTFAQRELTSNELMYHSFRLPQSNQLNPAFFPRSNKFYLSLPSFGFSFGLPVSYKDLGLNYDPATNKSTLDIFDLTEKIGKNNQLNFDLNVDVLGFGFRVGRGFVTFQASAVLNGNLTLPKGAIDALTDQSNSMIGKDNAIQLASGDLLTINSYMRFSIGGGYELQDIPLTIGGHINILDGIANINTDETNIQLYASDNYYSSIIADMDYCIKSAGVISYNDGNAEINGSANNMGFTFDLGAQYIHNDNWIFSAALIDVGPGIHWKQNIETHTPKSNHIIFSGFDITNLFNGGEFDDQFAQNFRDSITATYEMNDAEGEDFWYAVPTKIKLGASYTFADNMFRAGFLFHGQWDKGLFCSGHGFNVPNNRFRFNTTLSFNASLYDWLEVIVANSLVFDSHRTDFVNPGIGFVVTPFKVIQLYTMFDYLSNFYVADSKRFNVAIGMNVLFGNKSTKKVDYNPLNTNETPVIEENAQTGASTEE